MKKISYILLLGLLYSSFIHAQRLIPKQKGLEVDFGTFSKRDPFKNYYISMIKTVNAHQGRYQLWALEYGHEYAGYKHLRIPVETYTAFGGYSFPLLSDNNRSIALNAALTGILGYESVNRGNEMLYDGSKVLNESGFIYGIGGRLSLETYLCDRVILLVVGRSIVFWSTSLDQFRPSLGVGLRFNF